MAAVGIRARAQRWTPRVASTKLTRREWQKRPGTYNSGRNMEVGGRGREPSESESESESDEVSLSSESSSSSDSEEPSSQSSISCLEMRAHGG